MKRQGHLFEKLISDDNLRQAIDEVNKTHHWFEHHIPNDCTAWVEITKEDRIQDLKKILINGFEPKPPRVMRKYDQSAQKWRKISEPRQWPDQYVHHALIQVLQPVMMRGMDPYCCGSIKGRGTIYAKKAIERWMRRDPAHTKYCLSLDIRHFYESVKPEVIMDRMRRIVKDRRILDLIETITAKGIQIGAYTSQWFANTVLQPLDHMIRECQVAPDYYVRYMDNFTIFCGNKRRMGSLRYKILLWLNAHKLQMKGDWQIFNTRKRLPCAVGYRYGRTYTIPRKRNLLMLKRKLAKIRRMLRKHRKPNFWFAAGLISRIGILEHCNNTGLYRKLFQGEKIMQKLKSAIRFYHKGGKLTWTTYLAMTERVRSSRPRAMCIRT